MLTSEIEVRREVLGAIAIVAGKEFPGLSDSMRPIGDLGLMSQEGVDFAGEIECRLGIELDAKFNPFVDDNGKCGRTIGEIVDLIEKAYSAHRKEVKRNGRQPRS